MRVYRITRARHIAITKFYNIPSNGQSTIIDINFQPTLEFHSEGNQTKTGIIKIKIKINFWNSVSWWDHQDQNKKNEKIFMYWCRCQLQVNVTHRKLNVLSSSSNCKNSNLNVHAFQTNKNYLCICMYYTMSSYTWIFFPIHVVISTLL